MMQFSRKFFWIVLLAKLVLPGSCANAATITEFTSWQVFEDPEDSNFSGSSTETSATLSATGGPISAGVDVGFRSTDGNTVAQSTFGNFFDPGSDFGIAIDYSLSFGSAPEGVLGLGFGVGEEASGENSAGVSFLTRNGSPILSFGGAARVNDVNETPLSLGLTPTLSGSLFLEYEAASGNITVGASQTIGDSAPTAFDTFVGLQDRWNGSDLLVSFFIRSDSFPLMPEWQGDTADAVFSNFRVLHGEASAVAVPEANGVVFLLGLSGLTGIYCLRKARKSGANAQKSHVVVATS